jgi:16S rRNA (uracil1498-N3)-methyltransferase
VAEAGKRAGAAVEAQTRRSSDPPDLWLLFAPIKKARTDFIVEKAAEMGAARIMPVQTDFTNAERIRQDRLQAHAVEAAEQCGGTYVPPVEELQRGRPRCWTTGRGPAPGLRGRGAGGRAGPLSRPDAGNGPS